MGLRPKVEGDIPERAEFVAIRAHDLRLFGEAEADNTFPCWLVASAESPFETTLHLRLNSEPHEGDSSHLEAEVAREQWARLSGEPQPWRVTLDAERLLFLER